MHNRINNFYLIQQLYPLAIKEHVAQQIIQNKVTLAKQANILFEQYFPTAPTKTN